MQFAVSYSCGKDSTLALHKMLQAGHTPVALIVMFNDNAGRSWFHGASEALLNKYADALEIPVILCHTKGEDYAPALENGLKKAMALGAEAICFGDIDVPEYRQWDEERCKNAGIQPLFPLWGTSRRDNALEVVDAGYTCILKIINKNILPKSLLGKALDPALLEEIESYGADICGENGEYHTIAVNGPAFKKPLDYQTGTIADMGDYAALDLY